MSDTDTKAPGDKTLHMSPKTLSLKRPMEQNTVRQSFSHGRSKAVVVETVKRRAPGSGAAPARDAAPASRPPAGVSPRARRPPRRQPPEPRPRQPPRRGRSAPPPAWFCAP
jgi:translation initiation factor IF-2